MAYTIDKDAPPRPGWRITCFYVDKRHRGEGIDRQVGKHAWIVSKVVDPA